MAEKWRKYETLLIFGAELGTEGTEALVQKVRDYVTQDGGRILKTERWGLRDLAFELKGHARGYYLLLEYAGVPRIATEVDRKLNLIDSIIKFQTVKLDVDVDPATLPETEEVVAAPELKTAPALEPAGEATGEDAEATEEAE